MTLFLNQIFYPSHSIKDNDSLKSLEKYMLNNENMINFLENHEDKKQDFMIHENEKKIEFEDNIKSNIDFNEKINDSIVLKEIKEKRKDEFYYTKKEDSLFWSIFIAHHGMKEYEYIGKKYANRELEEKQKIMEYIKKNPSFIKQMNFKVTNVLLQEILSDLLMNKKTSLATFLAFVSYYKKRVFIVRKNTYLMYNFENSGFQYYSPEKDCCEAMGFVILQYNPDTQSYGIDQEINQDKIGNIINTKLCIDHFLKPLKGVSNYKVCELETMAGKLNLQYNPNFKKNDLYKMIYDETLWV